MSGIWIFPSAMQRGRADGYKHPKLFVNCNDCDNDNIASWAVHIKSLSSDLVNLSLVMLEMSHDRSVL